MNITKVQAKAFYKDLCGTVYGDPDKNSQGRMPIELIADHMKTSVEVASEFCNAMVKHGITERSGGMIVV